MILVAFLAGLTAGKLVPVPVFEMIEPPPEGVIEAVMISHEEPEKEKEAIDWNRIALELLPVVEAAAQGICFMAGVAMALSSFGYRVSISIRKVP